MEHESLEVKTNFEADFLPKHPEVIFGPRDATDHARGLLLGRAENLAQVAVINFGAYEDQRAKLVTTVHQTVAEGNLRLGADFKDMSASQQVEQFVATAVTGFAKPRDEVVAVLKAEKAQQNLGSKVSERELRRELIHQKDVVRIQAERIIYARDLLVEGGATDDFMRKYNYTTGLMTKPERQAYEQEMQLDPGYEAPLVDTGETKLFDKFKDVLATTFSTAILRRVGIRAPRSGEVTVVEQHESAIH